MGESSTRPRPSLHHINLKTRRVDEMIAWYGTVIGTTVVHRFAGGAWLTNDHANHRIALLTSSKISDDADKLMHTGLHHTSFEFASHDDLLETVDRLSGEGIEPHMCLDHGMTLSFYFVDPDGNSVELQADNFGDWSESSAFMRDSPDFKRDPIGTPFDPQKLVEAWKAGVPKEELHRRAYAGELRPGSPLNLRFPAD